MHREEAKAEVAIRSEFRCWLVEEGMAPDSNCLSSFWAYLINNRMCLMNFECERPKKQQVMIWLSEDL